MEFMREYPDDASCLDRLWRDRFAPDGHHARCPRCERERKFHRTKTRASYTCDTCGLHVHPMKGTIFEKSTTSLHQWFYAMYLMASTRCGISAKQLEREIGVGYKTAHRIMKKVRTELMNDLDDEPLRGDVEIDETSWGGKPRVPLDRAEAAAFREAKPTVLGMVERRGRVRARVIASRCGAPLSRAVLAAIDVGAAQRFVGRPVVREDDRGRIDVGSVEAFRVVDDMRGNTHTNTIEGFFGNLKTGMRAAYKKVSLAYLQSQVDEYAWRYNARHQGKAMFEQLVQRVASVA